MSVGDRLRKVEMREQADMIMVATSPNGSVSAAEGTYAYDTVLNILWINHDGATGWYPVNFGGGVPFGEIYSAAGGSVAVNNVGIGNKVQVLVFDTNGQSAYMTPDHTNDHIVVSYTGKYLITANASASSLNTDAYEIIVFRNNGATECPNLHAHETVATASAVDSFSVSGLCALTAGNTVELWLVRNSGPAAARSLNFEHVNLACVWVGP